MKSCISRDKVIFALHGWMKPKKEDDSTEPSVGLIDIACKDCARQVAITLSLETQLSITEHILGTHAWSRCLHQSILTDRHTNPLLIATFRVYIK